MKRDFRFREIPYNYTSFSDREIILRFLGEEAADIIDHLRTQRVTGRSAKLLSEIIGDLFIIDRNPYIFDDFLKDRKKLGKLKKLHQRRLDVIAKAANGNPFVEKLVKRTISVDRDFFERFTAERWFRQKITLVLQAATSRKNIYFSPFHKVAHCTDATDWRVEYPEVVVYPDSVEEIAGLVKAAKRLRLSIIPRGGGTGLTGGAIPVQKRTMVINTEKLNAIGEIEIITDGPRPIPVVSVEAGAVTDDVIEKCAHHGYIFATDPTSAWASTIGGNIAENAGGKKCVMWGTAIDNLYSYRIVDATGSTIEVVRRNHPHRKIDPTDGVVFDVFRLDGKQRILLKSIMLTGTEVRKRGLGKDITNKALKGLPGVQKEGGDGIIVSARFVLYSPFTRCTTLCLEFFGSNLINASKAIVEITERFKGNDEVFLTALEHFDEKYVLAINYRNKSDRTETPKAVLLIDVESNDASKLEAACRNVVTLVRKYDTEAAIAANDVERSQFWADRKNLGAIAKHTNAFKLNEDVVIPLERLPEFSDFIEKLNLQKEIKNRIEILRQLEALFSDKPADDGALLHRIALFRQRVTGVRELYSHLLGQLDMPATTVLAAVRMRKKNSSRKSSSGLTGLSISSKPGKNATLFSSIRDGSFVLTFETDIIEYAQELFYAYTEKLDALRASIETAQKRKIIIATHMHAGDGNVHVNIPVHSNDYLMMKEADEVAASAMKEAVRLGGVISGEHGIGLTKLRFIERDVLDAYQQYKRESDPDDVFNPGKLSPDFHLDQIYTPSFNLLELEAFILEATDLGTLSTSIAPCVRCGKCKSVCNTHFPEGNLFYNPRNKILGTGLIIEAMLYDAQISNTVSFKHLPKLKEIASHCTMCHKCETPCPAKIDFGDVTLKMREVMVERRKARTKPITRVALYYLRRKGYYVNKFFRLALLKTGYSVQRLASAVLAPIADVTEPIVPTIHHLLRSKMPKSGQPSFRDHLKLKGAYGYYCLENPSKPVIKSVFYFPGCGSERMFPEISMATLAMLYYSGVRVVIPPEYLCCGYPFLANGRTEQAEMKSYNNRVVLHRIAGSAGYMNIKNVIISCGTCYEMLETYKLESIFRGAALIDINEFLAQNNLFTPPDTQPDQLLYHEPCHTPLRAFGAGATFTSLLKTTPTHIDRCCGEGGTLALSYPEIANCLRDRKRKLLLETGARSHYTVLTTCPSCVQGLSRINGSVSVAGKSLVVHLAERMLGERWQQEFLTELKKNGVEKVLL